MRYISERSLRFAPQPPVERSFYEQTVAEAHARLGARTFATTWAEGRGMMAENALRNEEDDEAC